MADFEEADSLESYDVGADTESAIDSYEEPETRSFTVYDPDEGDIELDESQLQLLYNSALNEKKWKNSLREKGEKLNKQEQEFQERMKAENTYLENRKRELVAKERKQWKQQQQYQQQSERDTHIANINASYNIIEMSRAHDDFDWPTIKEFSLGYNWQNFTDKLEIAYYAWRGKNLEERLSEARADVIREAKKKGRGVPAGHVNPVVETTPRSIEEVYEQEKKRRFGKKGKF